MSHEHQHHARNASSNLKLEARSLAGLPNTIRMSDSLAEDFADLSMVFELLAIYIEKFISTNDKDTARKFLELGTRASTAITDVTKRCASERGLLALQMAQKGLITAHTQFRAHIDNLIVANSATAEA